MRELGPRARRRGQKVQTDSLDGRPVAAATRRRRNFPTTSGTSAPGVKPALRSTSGRVVGDEAIIAAGESEPCVEQLRSSCPPLCRAFRPCSPQKKGWRAGTTRCRSEEHTSELQSP